MQVTIDIPDELAAQMAPRRLPTSPRAARESLAIEGYRTERFSESEIRRLLWFENRRLEVHAFLKEHGAWPHHSFFGPSERDRESALRAESLRGNRISPPMSVFTGMIVVADTTPVNCLILIGEIDVLPQLFSPPSGTSSGGPG